MKYILSILAGISIYVLTYNILGLFGQKPTHISVEIDAEVLKDDLFQLFYHVAEEVSFDKKHKVNTRVKGQEGIQKIVFRIPADKDVQKLRLDIGTNKEQAAMKITNLAIKSDNKSISFKENFFEVFTKNQYINYEEPYLITMELADRYDPFFVSAPLREEFRTLRQEQYTFSPTIQHTMALIVAIAILFFTLQIQIKQTYDNLAQNAFISVFIVMLNIPLISTVFNLEKGQDQTNFEKRKLTERPEFSFRKSFPQEYESYYNDNFGFRNTLVNWASQIKLNFFKTSPRPGSVLFGKDNFLFYNSETDVYPSYSNANLMSPSQLEHKYQELVLRKQRLNKRGIAFICAFAPNKHTIYSEYLPHAMHMQKTTQITLADQMVDYFGTRGFPIIDMRAELLEAKQDKLIYCKLDSHWNADGAYIGYKTFMNKAYPILNERPHDIEDFNIIYLTQKTGDLVNMLAIDSISNYIDIRPVYSLKNKENKFTKLDVTGFPSRTEITRNEFCGNRKKVLIFRDSYTSALMRFLSSHFYEVTYIWTDYNESIVKKVNPDVVISFRLERYLKKL